MAGLPAEPNTFFSVGPDELAKPECFAVKRGEVSEARWDADLHHPEYARLLDGVNALSNTALIYEIIASPLTSGFAAGQGNRAQPGEDSVPQIRPTQIRRDGEIDLSEAYGIRVQDIADRNYIQHGEVLFNNTNSTALVGKSAVFVELGPTVCSNHVTRLRLREGIEPEFVEMVLNWLQKRGYFARLCTNFNNQAGVNTETLSSVRIPFPPASQRKELVTRMLLARAERKTKLAEADALLAGLDDFVLDALGIALPPEDSRRAFAVRLGQSRVQGPLNADFYHPERIRSLHGLGNASENMAVMPLIAVVDFAREQIKTPGENYLSLAHVQSHTGELTDSTDTASGNCFIYQAGDVLFARLRPYLNKVYHAEMDGCCSTEFHVLRVKDVEMLLPEYLGAILRSRLILAQTVHMMTGNTHPRLANANVESLRIPIPQTGVQEIISSEVIRRREESRRLRAEADAGWQEAKRWFEEQLLG